MVIALDKVHLVPTPPDWDDSAHGTGQWFLGRSSYWQPPPGLPEFLAASPPAVFVGFGSIAGRDPERTTSVILQALRLSGQRAVLVGGWGGLRIGKAPDSVRFYDSMPYDWLFPRVAAVVHHGGAGSTGEGLRAGKPTVVCPFFGDQPFWGRRVCELGVGPPPIPQKRLNAPALAEAIRAAVADEGMRSRALALGEKIRAEDGMGSAVEIVHELLARWSHNSA